MIDERKNAMTNPHKTNETNIPEANYSVRVPESRKRQQKKKKRQEIEQTAVILHGIAEKTHSRREYTVRIVVARK